MKRLLLTAVCCLSLAAVAQAAGDEDGFVGPNRLRNNDAVQVYRENAKGVPAFVEGSLGATTKTGDHLQATLDFFEQNKGAYRMENPAEELQPVRIDIDDLGMRHVRMEQRYQGIRVIGGQMIAHFTESGTLKAVNGNYEPDIAFDITPALSATEATIIASTDLKSFFGDGSPDEPELVVFPWEKEYYLAWRLLLYSDTPMGRWEYFVDANSGEVIFNANRIMNEGEADDIGTGTGVMGDARDHIDTDFNGSSYDMIDLTRRASNNPHGHGGQMPAGNDIRTHIAGASLPGTLATDADNVWDDPNSQSPAVDGQVYSGLVYDYLLNVLNRNGYDDNGASMLTIVNYSGDGDNNAYWDGSRIVVWSWGAGWRSLAGCPDVIAHEWGHAVTETTSGMVYQKESGALNESFSDMIGAAFEFYHDTLDVPDWQMGENGRLTGVGFRDMADPHSAGDPDFYGTTDPFWIDVENCTPSNFNDWCGVHTNSGVGNKWFYLLSDGGTAYGVTVTGIGVQNAMQIAYRANAFYWTSNVTYHEAALATITAANELDTSGAWALQASKAWQAVGVATPGPGLVFTYPAGLPSTVIPDETTEFDVLVGGSLGGVPIAGSGQLHYNIDGGAWTSVSMVETLPNQYTATLPATPCDSYIEFYVSAEETDNGVFTDPDSLSPNTAIVATNVVTVFADNFESDLGWTVSGTATDGQWDRGVPAGLGERGDPATDFDGSGSCFLTDNEYGNSDVDGGVTILTSPTFDLSAGDARIHYARWYSNNTGADPNNDVFTVYISNDDGFSWSVVETVGPLSQSGGGWYEYTFWVTDIIAPTNQMKLRFDASDLNDGSLVEAAIDDVSVTRFECDLAVPSIVTNSLPDWTEGQTYSQQLESTGGGSGHTWADKFGDLTGTGLSVSGSGLLSGVPVTTGLISFTAEVTDDGSQSAEKLFEFTINDALAVTTDSLPSWTVNQSYSQQLEVAGGTGAKSWADANGDLVGTGLTINGSGEISGIPLSAGPISFTALVDDITGDTEQKLFTITVNPAVAVVTTSLPNGRVEGGYLEQLAASGGTGAPTWNDLNDDLSGTGLSLSQSGLITGTPLATGLVTFTAIAEDFTGSSDQVELSIQIDPAYICGDVNNSGDGPDISDLTYLVNYLFLEGAAPQIPEAANVNGAGEIDISDITYLVNHLFAEGPAPTCGQ